jgi:tetratricopeptide (TPR) repeat protein
MFASKKLGFTLILSSLLAACASTPKPSSDTSVVSVDTENSDVDLEKLAKERASQGLVTRKSETQEKSGVIADGSKEPQLANISDELKALASPLASDYGRAIVLMKANQLDEAFALFEEIQTKAPQLTGPLLNQALIHIQKQQYKEADVLLQKAVATNSKNPFSYNLQGFVYRQLGQFKKAREAYEQALALSPNYAKAHFNLGVLAELYLQDLPLALTHYEAYQNTQTEADSTVAKWVIDLQKRTGVYKAPVRKPAVTEAIIETPPAIEATSVDNNTENAKNSEEMTQETATSSSETVKSSPTETDTTSVTGVQP